MNNTTFFKDIFITNQFYLSSNLNSTYYLLSRRKGSWGSIHGMARCVSGNREAQRQGEKWGKGQSVKRSEHTQHLSIKFGVLYGHGSWWHETITKVTLRSQITIMNNNEKVCNIGKITKTWQKDRKWIDVVRKMAPIDLLHVRLP